MCIPNFGPEKTEKKINKLKNQLNKNTLNKKAWDQWFAGLVDADGCLLINSKGYTSLEITMGIFDEHTLQQIKQKFGGSVKLRSKAQAFRYRLHNKQGMLTIIQCLNGLCYNSVRRIQLENLCLLVDVAVICPGPLTINNGWFAGFFDGDGTLSYSFKNGWPQLTISISNKKKENCKLFHQIFAGYIRLDTRLNTYKWEIYKKEQIEFFCAYLKNYPLRSYKKKRIWLISEFFKLRQVKAYSQPRSSLINKKFNI